MSQLSKLTIIILTYNRPLFAIRSMKYWSGSDITVHILDGSSEALKETKRQGISDNVHYHHLPISLYERLKLSVDMVKTEFSVLLSDDEYFLPKGLEICINELDNNKDIVACMGRCLYMWPRKGRITLIPYYMWWKSIMQDTPQERMEASMSVLHSVTIYAVMRSENWINCIKILAEKEFSCVYIPEHQFELFSVYQGKAKLIDELTWLRSGENHPTAFKNWNRDFGLEDWYRKKGNEEEFNEFFKILTKHALAYDPGINIDETEKGFRKAGNIWVVKAESGKTRMSKIKEPFRKFAEKIAANLPKSIKYPLKDLLGLNKNQFDFKEIPEKLKEMGISFDIDNLRVIEKQLKDFYN